MWPDGSEHVIFGRARVIRDASGRAVRVLPHTSGPEIAERLLSVRPEMKVVLMSGFAGESIAPRARASEWPFVQKPFTPQSLTAQVRTALDAR